MVFTGRVIYLEFLSISPHGNAFGVGSEPDLHGHFIQEGHYKKRYFEQLIDFINTKGTSIQPTLNLWRCKKYDTLIKHFNGLDYKVHNLPRDIDDVFLSKALQRYDSLFTTSENRPLITCLLYTSGNIINAHSRFYMLRTVIGAFE